MGAVGGLPDHRDLRRRRLAAQAADAARPRSAGADGRARARRGRRRPPAADAAGRARSDPDRLRAAGRLRAAQVGGAARRPRGARANHRDRGGGDARPHRAHAARISAPRSRSSRSARTAAASRCRASPSSCRAPVVVPADPSSAAFPLVAALIVPGSEIDPRRRDDQSAAHRPVHDAARDGRDDRGRRPRATKAARTSPTCACALGALKGVDVPAERAPVDDRRISGARRSRRRSPKARRACAA